MMSESMILPVMKPPKMALDSLARSIMNLAFSSLKRAYITLRDWARNRSLPMNI